MLHINKMLAFACLLSITSISAVAHDKVVVIPIGDSDSLPVLTPGDKALVQKTGANLACVTCVTGDDADLQRGVPFPSPRFVRGADGSVLDLLTDLIWLTNANCNAASSGTLVTWSDAIAAVDELNSSGTMDGNDCGDTSNDGSHQTDWRLPNIREMHSLVDFGQQSPALPNTAGTGRWEEGDPFDNVINGRYWSSTTDRINNPFAWYVRLSVGDIAYSAKNNPPNDFGVWAVRGGQ